MRKTKFFAILITIVMILSAASVVNATTATTLSVSADKTTVKKGDEVTITLHSTQATEGARFQINYNHEFLKYKESSAQGINEAEGLFEFNGSAKKNDFKITFSVIGTEGSDTVTITPIQITNGSNDNYTFDQTLDPVTITIQKEQIPDQGTETPGTETETPGTETETPGTGTETPDTNTTETPTKMPQTGVNVLSVVGIVALIVLAAVIVKKARK